MLNLTGMYKGNSKPVSVAVEFKKYVERKETN
jgi:hypothetical protein